MTPDKVNQNAGQIFKGHERAQPAYQRISPNWIKFVSLIEIE